MLEWLGAPVDPTRAHEIGALLSWHGRAMVAAWSVIVPIAILAARFFKIFPGQDWPNHLDDKRWWRTHRWGQYAALAVMGLGLYLILKVPKPTPGATASAGIHHLLGWATLALGSIQYVAAWLRGTKGGPTEPAPDGTLRGDHYDMSRRRRIFERLHKSIGYLALLISIAAVITGLWQANAPRWMFATLWVWYACVVAAFVLLQRRGMARDTYQAIWGPDPAHPGNGMRPIGLGVNRTPPLANEQNLMQ